MFALFLVVGWLFVARPEARLKASVTVLVPAFFLVGVWSVRNYAVFDSVIFLTTIAGAGLYWGNAEPATIDGGDVDFVFDGNRQVVGLNDAEQNRHFMATAIGAMSENKARAVRFFYNAHYPRSEESFAKHLAMLVTYVPLLALFLLRVVSAKRVAFSGFGLLLVALYVTSGLVYAVFQTRIRYRLPFDFRLIAVVASFAAGVARRWVQQASDVGAREMGRRLGALGQTRA